ncbi:1-deoxy-D-xylulose 5-phosphate reductoisomerase [Arboricoccus pini]|uniref:1-deoxy-D-xylulose 5-phosphate reductoisomerase n=1 Tax=Arboricoccus pini TaxID=1963835 RepID=A0A212R758_9PROT|nr:1-deoxy-D-xylulose-5-phosphate reductoisomerase [Arboricoccus pini]SNB67992.1 1-deoxy-D-xylulose 5-phosphate reductoisomerase [Arboricoccus pini]
MPGPATEARFPDRPRRVSILGATGSIGRSTAALLRERPDLYDVQAIVGGDRAAELAALALALGAKRAVIANPDRLAELSGLLAGSDIEVEAGREAVVAAAALPADWIMSAITGAAGLEPTMAALRQGSFVALANKESIVCAGDLMIKAAHAHGSLILPVDSEHNAIFQCLGSRGESDGAADMGVEKLILTASGGPFRQLSLAEMAHVRPSDALAHPVWSMGAKISIDSATMMNKGFEIIEAHHLFGLPPARIEVLVHPQSVIHSMVGFVDGSHLAQLGSPDMRIPIASTLGWPERLTTGAPRLDLAEIGDLTFEPPDPIRFPALRLARSALEAGGTAPALLNAANEVAVEAFLQGAIGFLDIARICERVLDDIESTRLMDLAAVALADQQGRALAKQLIG